MNLNLTNIIAFSILLALLVVSSLIIFIFRHQFSPKTQKELYDRMVSWWIMVTIFILALSISPSSMLIFFAFVSYLALKEYFTVIPTRRVDRRAIFWAYISIPCQYVLIHIHWYGLYIIFIPIFMFLFIPIRMVILKESKGFLVATGTIHWGLMLTVYFVSHIAYLGVLPTDADWINTGISLIIYLVFLTQFNDVSQYLWGKFLGHKKIIPAISPNKTVAGFLGGVLTTCLLGFILGPILTPFTLPQALLAGFLIGVSGFLGDLAMSAIKRDLGIKDTGQLLPGHGGILDRLDSIIFTAPIFFHYVRYLVY
ncbi:phosphatidate cytidylyltransferase [Legionella sp. W05-934-2]|jgi:phosphatidate cytidylyltransferase|uniref:phosphatidate cytidylyltransferase n=1 Tax=Legionella sp. W05-934-2 TaxID=1198649 RepID=UPI003462EC4D